VQKLFFSTVGGMLRKEESKSLTGATWIFISAFLCALLFRDDPHIAFMALSMFILGDAIAAVVGLSMGRIKIGKKSLEGALANFFLSLVLMTVVFPSLPQLLSSWNGVMPMAIAVVAALSTTLFELFPIRLGSKVVINDNLIVPIITGFLIKWLYPLVGSVS
jgi:dolichol kinase